MKLLKTIEGKPAAGFVMQQNLELADPQIYPISAEKGITGVAGLAALSTAGILDNTAMVLGLDGSISPMETRNFQGYRLTLTVPLYCDPPGAGLRTPGQPWVEVEAAGFPIVNRVSIMPGYPGSTPNADWLYWINALVARGIEVYWYLTSGYATQTIEYIKTTINLVFSTYPNTSGIFLDEMDAQAYAVPYYQQVWNHILLLGKKLILNPGTTPDPKFYAIAHGIMDFESAKTAYSTFASQKWQDSLPARKRWHAVHTCATLAEAQWCMAKANAMGVSEIYPTDQVYGVGILYSVLPTYWTGLITELNHYRRTYLHPIDIPGCVLHADAEHVTDDGAGGASVVANQTYLAINLEQTTQANRLQIVAEGVNGLPVLRASGNQWAQNQQTAQLEFTFVAVYRNSGTNRGRVIGTLYDGVALYTGTQGNPGQYNAGNYQDGSIYAGDNWVIVVGVFSAYNQLTRLWVNGQLANTSAPWGSAAYYANYISMGAAYDGNAWGGPAPRFSGDIYAIDVYERALCWYQMQSITDYYAAKLGLAL